MRFDQNKHVYFNYSDFTSSYELFSQALKSSDYVLSGSKRNIAWRRKMQTEQLRWCTRNVHPSFADFWPGLGVNVHILLTQNWLWEPSLSLWCVLFRIKLDLFGKKLNLKKHLQPKNGWSSPSTFWHRLIYDLVPKGAHAISSALELKIKHCWKLLLLKMCCVLKCVVYLHQWKHQYSTDNFSNQAVVDFMIQSSHTEKALKNDAKNGHPCTKWFSSLCLQTNCKHMEKQSLIYTWKT